METVKIVFDIDSKDVKTTTDELKALNKVTTDEIKTLDKLSNTAKDAGDGFVSLRTRVKEAKEEAVKAAEKYGEFSKQANDAKLKAGALADQMSDLNRQVNLLNPEAKAKAFSNLAQGIVGSFSVATGALQAFGVKNKEVEEIAMKLQGALNIAQGISSFKGLKESINDVKVVLGFTSTATNGLTAAQRAQAISAAQAVAGTATLTAAQEAEAIAAAEAAAASTAFGAALAATGIGAIVVVIGLLVGAMLALGGATKSDEIKQKEFEDQLKNTNQELDNQRGLVTRLSDSLSKDAQKSILEAKLRGASEKEIGEIRKKSYQQSRQLLADDVAKQKKAFDEASTNTKLKWEDFEKFEKRYYESAGALRDLDYNYQLENLNNELSLQDKAQQERDKAKAKRAQDAKAQEQEALKLLKLRDDIRKQLQQNELSKINDPKERIQQEKQYANEEYVIQLERLKNAGAAQEEIDKLSADHSTLIQKLNTDEINANKTKNDKILEQEDIYQKALLALQLAQQTDPLKRAQIINDAKEKEIDNQLALIAKGSKEEQALLLDKERAEIEAAKRIGEAQVEANKKSNQTIAENDKKAAEDKKAIQDAAFQSAAFLGATLFEGIQRQNDQELANLNDQKEKKLINEKEYQRRLKEIKNKQAEDQKKQAIYNATLDAARAIIAALTIAPPASAIAANFAAVLSAANLAKIIATPVPKFQKGTLAVPGLNMGRDSVHAMLQPGEAVIPVQTNRAYHPTIKAIYERKISPTEINNFVMSKTKSGGASRVTASVDTYALSRALGKNKTVEVGNASVIGKAMARELMRGQNLRRL